jgi:hypothetical protein
MHDQEKPIRTAPKRTPWNKGKLTGVKPPLRPKHVWAIRTKLKVEGRTRDLAMFNLAIDSKLRGCDVAALKVENVAPGGYAVDRATVRQKKTGQPVRFELTSRPAPAASVVQCDPGPGARVTNSAMTRRLRCQSGMAVTSERTPERTDASTGGGRPPGQ